MVEARPPKFIDHPFDIFDIPLSAKLDPAHFEAAISDLLDKSN